MAKFFFQVFGKITCIYISLKVLEHQIFIIKYKTIEYMHIHVCDTGYIVCAIVILNVNKTVQSVRLHKLGLHVFLTLLFTLFCCHFFNTHVYMRFSFIPS